MEHQQIHDRLVQIYGRAGFNEITTSRLRYLNDNKTVWEIDVEAKVKNRLRVDEIFHSVATNNTFDSRIQIINEPAYPAQAETSTQMETKQFFRKPFDVNAVEVTPYNALEVAEWCGGEVALGDYKHSKFRIKLPVVKVPGNGPNKGKVVEARVGYFVVEHNGSFRVYRPKQFEETFHQYSENGPFFKPGDLVRDKENDTEGTVLHVDQVLVNFPGDVNILFERTQLERIREFSEETKQRIREIEEAEIGLDKLNALRDAAREALENGTTLQGRIEDETLAPATEPDEIGGYWKGMRVRVTLEANAFHEQFGTVERLSVFGNAVFVTIDGTAGDTVPFQLDEIEPVSPKLQAGDMIETLVKHDFDGVTVPVRTNGRVHEVDDCDGHNVHIMFADGHYSWFAAYQLNKI